MSNIIKVGKRVEVSGKEVQGVVAFIGNTNFAPGKWIGLILDQPKGKNNGSVQGIEYFKCDDSCGVFVRETQLVCLDEHGKPIDKSTPERESSIPTPRVLGRSRQSISRMSLTSSRQSLADSRQSLSGSRQSLAGSRSHLASPALEKPPEANNGNNGSENATQIPKRASFVETGFVETLKPQFTPGATLTATPTPVTSVEDKINALQLQQELENRAQQIRDLNEKIETLKLKRQDDKERLKDYDKLKIQLEALVEFKTKIMESQNSLQRDLQRAKQDAKEAVEARETHAEEVADLAEAVEMATLDREMAEEKAETLQLELEVCKEKLEEVTLDLEILKTEMQEKGSTGGTGIAQDQGGLSAYEIKQLQQQNARLRETLVRLRDLSAHDKHEHQKLLKDLDQKKSEITELGKTKEKLSVRVENMEQQIADLQEQVDAALGAEEMVIILGEQKLSLEEKVAELQEEVSELEALQDMNDQLVESNAELEADLREELDMSQAAIREAIRDRDAALETIADRESTINKFRSLVQQLQEQSLNLQQRLEQETSKPVSALPEIIDFKKMFTETKAHTKAIDLELRKIELQQLQNHIKYLCSFMPESFMTRGGDHEAVLILLLVPRLMHKSDILLSKIKDKFAVVDKIDRFTLTKGHTVEQYSFRCRISYYILALQSILRQYYYGLNTCKPDTLLKVGATYPEMAAQEKIIDGFVELVKRDQLDENVPLDALEKCLSYFNTLYPVLLGAEAKLNQTQLISDYVKLLQNVIDAFGVDSKAIRSVAQKTIGEICILMQHVLTVSDQLQQQLKLVKRKLPPDTNLANLGFSNELLDNLQQCTQHSVKIMKTLYETIKNSLHTLSTSGETDLGLTDEQLKDIAMSASDKIYEQDDLGPTQSIKNSLEFMLTQITQVAQFLQDNEFEISTASKNEKNTPPIQIRSESVKKELEQTKTLTSRLENKESDIKEMKKLLKEKQEQLSEMTIRKELAEKKLGNVNKDYELTIEKLQRKLEEAHNNFKKKEKEFEETLDHLQTDIDSLETEKGEMREKLKALSKKAQLESALSKSISGSQFSSLQSIGPSLPAVVKDSPLMKQEIETLRKLFHQERNERIKLENDQLKRQLDSLVPLPTFKNQHDEVLDGLFKEGAALKQEILMALAMPKFPQIYKVSPNNSQGAWQRHFAEENQKMLNLKMRADQFQAKVAKEAVSRSVGGKIQSDFGVFATNEMSKAINETKPMELGFVKIPKSHLSGDVKTGIINLELDFMNLQKVLHTLTATN